MKFLTALTAEFTSCATIVLKCTTVAEDLGDNVEAGEVIARVHDMTRTGAKPVEYRL